MPNPDQSSMKPLPDFVVIGAARAATTTMHAILDRIPSICMSTVKEPDFFVEQLNLKNGEGWYRSIFKDPGKLCGEVSPNYSERDRFAGVAARLHRANPDAKIIYIVRDPIARTISHYNLYWLLGRDIGDPCDILENDDGRIIVNVSKYAYQLEPYLDLFPTSQIKVLDFDDLRADPGQVIEDTCAFLGCQVSRETIAAVAGESKNSSETISELPSWWVRLNRMANNNHNPALELVRKYAPIKSIKAAVKSVTSRREPPSFDTITIDRLKAELHDDAQALRNLTGRAFSSWTV
jgi:hypothetical protein